MPSGFVVVSMMLRDTSSESILRSPPIRTSVDGVEGVVPKGTGLLSAQDIYPGPPIQKQEM